MILHNLQRILTRHLLPFCLQPYGWLLILTLRLPPFHFLLHGPQLILMFRLLHYHFLLHGLQLIVMPHLLRSRFLLHGLQLILMLRRLPFHFLLAWAVPPPNASPAASPFPDAWPAAPQGVHPIIYLSTLISRCRPPAGAPRPCMLSSSSGPWYRGAGLTLMHQGLSPHSRLHGNACCGLRRWVAVPTCYHPEDYCTGATPCFSCTSALWPLYCSTAYSLLS